jgi:hypothetical protein
MRITLDIDEPVLQVLKELARREGRTAGAVASDLIRRALSQPSVVGVQETPGRHGFRPFAAAPGEHVVTNEQVNRVRGDLGV